MKKNKIILTHGLAFIMLLSLGCKKILVENPYTSFTPEYFKTPGGFQDGINSLYSGMRFLYGPEGAVALGSVGTDEWTYAEQPRNGAGGTADFLTLGNYTLDPSNGGLLTPWNRSFNNINLANGLEGFAPNVSISAAEKAVGLGEIRFLRGLYYLNLVQFFGAVPVDLGAGDLKFNTNPFQGFNRLPMNDVLVKDYKTIIDDLVFASQNLPDKRPVAAFRLSKAAAFHLLAKAYLHRGYSTVSQPTDFTNAYTASTQVINNQALYGVALQSNYSNVHLSGNDYNSEILYAVERLSGNFSVNEVGNPTGIGGTKGVDASNEFNGDYTAIRAPLASSTTQPVSARTVQYGRPIRRFCPTKWTYDSAFADKVNDSRYEGSFRTAYITSAAVPGFTINVDTAFTMAFTNRIADSLNGILPFGPRLKPYRVVAPREFYFIGGSTDATLTRNMYPSLSKYEDPNKLDPNNAGTRPFPVCKLGETYLLAAEAALASGNVNEAMNLINVLKQRAAFRVGLSTAEINTRYNNIKINSSSIITLDYILDERTRELCGESSRWPDLAVRNKLVSRVTLYNSDAAPNIRANKHNLRPIPKEQLDRTNDPDKQKYQNPNY